MKSAASRLAWCFALALWLGTPLGAQDPNPAPIRDPAPTTEPVPPEGNTATPMPPPPKYAYTLPEESEVGRQYRDSFPKDKIISAARVVDYVEGIRGKVETGALGYLMNSVPGLAESLARRYPEQPPTRIDDPRLAGLLEAPLALSVTAFDLPRIGADMAPGGYAFLYWKMLTSMKVEDGDIAFLLCHAKAHSLLRHPAQLAAAAVDLVRKYRIPYEEALRRDEIFRLEKVQEAEADRVGLGILLFTGFPASCSIRCVNKMNAAPPETANPPPASPGQTRRDPTPPSEDRVRLLQEEYQKWRDHAPTQPAFPPTHL